MHNNVRWSARRSYVVLAFILIIIALVLAGCASFNRAEEKGRVTAATVEPMSRDDAAPRSTVHGPLAAPEAIADNLEAGRFGLRADLPRLT